MRRREELLSLSKMRESIVLFLDSLPMSVAGPSLDNLARRCSSRLLQCLRRFNACVTSLAVLSLICCCSSKRNLLASKHEGDPAKGRVHADFLPTRTMRAHAQEHQMRALSGLFGSRDLKNVLAIGAHCMPCLSAPRVFFVHGACWIKLHANDSTM